MFPEKINPVPQDFETRDFQHSIPIPGINGFLWFLRDPKMKFSIPNPIILDKFSVIYTKEKGLNAYFKI